MRVTDIAKKDLVKESIQRNSERLQQIRTDISSGQQVNRLSDDPIGATIIQDVVTSVSRNEQIAQNIDDNISWLERNEVELRHASELLTQARSLLVSQAGGSSTADSRRIVAQEINSIKDSLFSVANAKAGKLYLFSGTATLTEPLQYNEATQPAKVLTENIVQKDIAELLDVDVFNATFNGFSSNTYMVRISKTGPFGDALYQISDDGGENWSEDKVLLPNIDVHNPEGEPNDQITLSFSGDQGLLGDWAMTLEERFDISEATLIFPEGMEFVFLPNPHIGYKGNNQPKNVLLGDGSTVGINVNAEERFLKVGDNNVNVFDVLNSVEKSLIEDDSPSLSERINDLDDSMTQVLQKLSDVGNGIIKLEASKTKLDEEIFSRQKRLSEIRDVDLAEAVIDLNAAETESKTSLGLGGRLLQPSLMDFLR